jgi:hypothetical protein
MSPIPPLLTFGIGTAEFATAAGALALVALDGAFAVSYSVHLGAACSGKEGDGNFRPSCGDVNDAEERRRRRGCRGRLRRHR